MSRDYSDYLRDMLRAADEIATFLASTDTAEDLENDQMRLYAIAYALQIIGEVAKNTPQHVREKYPNVAWRGAAGLRDIIAYEYFRLEAVKLWTIVTQDVPLLRQQLQQILEQES